MRTVRTTTFLVFLVGGDEESAPEWKYYSLIYLTSVFAVLTAQNSCNSHKIKYVGTWQIFSSSSSMLLTFFGAASKNAKGPAGFKQNCYLPGPKSNNESWFCRVRFQ